MADDELGLDVARLVVPLAGGLWETGDPWEPFRLVDPAGETVAPAAAYLRDVQACGRSELTLRSYGMDLLRWFRFCWAAGAGVGLGDPGRGRRFLPVAADRGQARGGRRLCGRHRGALRDRTAPFLRLPP